MQAHLAWISLSPRGRFAYTALLPATQRALAIGDDGAGALASVNLAGYLAGVLAARHVAARPSRSLALRAGLALTALATVLGPFTTSAAAWAVLRGAAGVASGLVFVLASGAALEFGAPAGKLYGGVGFGIALSGAAAALVPAPAGWGAPWLLLGVAAAALAIPGWLHLAPIAPRRREDSGPLGDPGALGFGLVRLSPARRSPGRRSSAGRSSASSPSRCRRRGPSPPSTPAGSSGRSRPSTGSGRSSGRSAPARCRSTSATRGPASWSRRSPWRSAGSCSCRGGPGRHRRAAVARELGARHR